MKLTVDGQLITANAQLADTFFGKLAGLLGKTDLAADYCLALTPCSSIHMAFMKMPLDIAYLDKSGVVIALQWDLKPWRIGEIHKGAHTVLEAPVGGVLRSLKVGDAIKFVTES